MLCYWRKFGAKLPIGSWPRDRSSLRSDGDIVIAGGCGCVVNVRMC